jgi:glutathione reductase (NADPH)
MSDYDFDLFIIGAGSGGVRASRVAASHGARVAMAEEHRVGGTCVVRGCVPKKLLVYASHFAEDLQAAESFGWDVSGRRFDWATLRDNVLNEVTRLEGLYGQTLANNKVTLFAERAQISGPNSVRLASGEEVTAGTILAATGGWPFVPEFEGREHVLTSNEIFHLPELPKRILIAGGGYIANEFAGIFNGLGSEVMVVNRGDRILRGYDDQIADRLLQISTEKGVEFKFNAEIQSIVKNGDESLSVVLSNGQTVDVDVVLVAAGRAPNSKNLGLEAVGVALDKQGAIVVDDNWQTSVDSIFAVGDVTNRVQLTPVAIREGHAFADNRFGGKSVRVDYTNIPSAVFSNPPIGAVGLTEAEARAQLGEVKIYTSEFRAMKNAFTGSSERALYKMVVDVATDKVVGLHMIGPESPEILQAAAIAVKAGLTKADFDATIALHPSMAEELVLMK